ncbi:MAG: hypothetical protein A2075_18300 [Geobacteraceae bacterium GWC2_58_44]|nr:MAG: hypothetical protein A2075_18300 [Geobacteraceae bacterium GWC2_58_44]HBG08183.1 hypothetical protein [Geobacter sp.]
MTTAVGKAKTGIVTALLLLVALLPATARSEEPWRAGFEQTCSKTGDAMTLSVAELNTLLEKCAALQKIIETQEESVRKVYLKRLQLCRNLYGYVLEYKKNEQASK